MDPTIILLGTGLYLFGPRPKRLQPKPDMREVAAAQAQADTAKAQQAKAEALLEQMRALVAAKELEERNKQKEILTYGQETNEMASNALVRVPLEHRTAEVELAAEMVSRTGVAFSSILGQLRPDQREALFNMVNRLLSRQEEERKKAREELAAKDQQLVESVKERAVLVSQIDQIKVEKQKQEAEVLLTKAERDAKDAELRQANDKALTLMQRIGTNDGWFWKAILWGVGIWLWFTRVLPALAKSFAWARCLDGFNQFIFRLIVGSSNSK